MSRRAYRSAAVERDACLILLGFDPPHPVEWQHDPALGIRPFRLIDGRKIYTPDENDPRYMRPIRPAGHKAETYGPKAKASSVGTDRHTIDHTRRVTKAEEDFRARLLAKAKGEPRRKGKIPSRPFSKRREILRRMAERT